jgi:hypothetical protein
VTPTPLPIAVRALTTPVERPKRRTRKRPDPAQATWPEYDLVLDTETTTDRTQRLLFGSYRIGRWRGSDLQIVEEGLFHADTLPTRDRKGFACLAQYAAEHRADVIVGYDATLHLMSRSAFVRRKLFRLACEIGALVVGFNLPFDLSRLAVRASTGRRLNHRAFSLIVVDHDGEESLYRPRLRITSRNSRSAFMTWAQVRRPQGRSHEPGRFLDLRTLTHALTNESHSLASACTALGVEHGKGTAEHHGVITTEYITYNRRDVLASTELLGKLRTELDRHPIRLPPDKAYSPASVAKGYLDALGVQPLARKSALARQQIGASMVAYYGGRAECHVRRVPAPVVYLDFLSMYPTINCLLRLWDLHVAEQIVAVDATREVRTLLHRMTLDRCFDPAFWRQLTFFAQIAPDGDVLPARAQYGADQAFGIGVNPLTSAQPLWYAGPDLVAATLLTGRPPKVLQAFRLVPTGRQPGLNSVWIRGMVEVDPTVGDFFQQVVELRKRVGKDEQLPVEERRRLANVLKTMGNSGAYGILAEFNRQDRQEAVEVMVHTGQRPFRAETMAPEKAGRFCYPPVAALITAGARLMLALLERSVTDLGGTYAFCDTDSMAVVANRRGGLIACPGGPHRDEEGREAIQALSWAQVDAVVERFRRLSPYDPKVVPGSILKVEDVNFDPRTKRRREIECLAISAKRYALFTRSRAGQVRIVEQKEHGLGHLLNPLDPDAHEAGGSRRWIHELWQYLVERALGRTPQPPAWLNRPALSRLALSDPSLLNTFLAVNKDREYDDQVKPFNFALAAHVRAMGHPSEVDPTRFQLMAPYEKDPRRWFELPWVNRYDGVEYAITTVGNTGRLGIARVRTYADVLTAYETHPEVKSCGPDGEPCARHTVGLLQRRLLEALWVRAIGKESNKLDEVDVGIEHEWDAIRTVYHDTGSDWSEVATQLKNVPRSFLAQQTGLSLRRLTAIRQGYARPRPQTRQSLTSAVMNWMARRAGSSEEL